MQEIKYNGKYFDVIEKEHSIGIHKKAVKVGVLPYTIDDGVLTSVGVLTEYNEFRKELYTDTIITGTVDADDKDLIDAAIREFYEEGGIKLEDREGYIFLGSLRTAKNSDEMIHVFAVDVSDIKQAEKPEGDGSVKEKKSTFEMKNIGEAILTDESLFLASYLRLFDYFYHSNMKNK